MIDHRKILASYMRYIFDYEGITYINGVTAWGKREEAFKDMTDEDFAELDNVHNEVTRER